jgi:hypothetical protein
VTKGHQYLDLWDELVGTLECIDTERGKLRLDAGVLELPTETIQMSVLGDSLGRMLAIISTDDDRHPYHICELMN